MYSVYYRGVWDLIKKGVRKLKGKGSGEGGGEVF